MPIQLIEAMRAHLGELALRKGYQAIGRVRRLLAVCIDLVLFVAVLMDADGVLFRELGIAVCWVRWGCHGGCSSSAICRDANPDNLIIPSIAAYREQPG
jgi:hypothetical protein